MSDTKVTPRPCPACENRGDVSRQDETLTRCENNECDVRLYATRPEWSRSMASIRNEGGPWSCRFCGSVTHLVIGVASAARTWRVTGTRTGGNHE